MIIKAVETKRPVRENRNQKLGDGTVVQNFFVESEDDAFILIEAEALSMSDEFMQHKPKNEMEREIKRLIAKAIGKKVKNFYCRKYDPAFTEDGKGICFEPGRMPAVGMTYNWWRDVAKKYNPKRNSRLGTMLEYAAFLGVLIKKLIDEGYGVEWAWYVVCTDSCELGHYRDSANPKLKIEPTGSRAICGLYDLANVGKILAYDIKHPGFWIVSGDYDVFGMSYPVANFSHLRNRDLNNERSVGWIVLS